MGIPWDGTGINCYGMGQINMSHGQPCEFPQQRVVVNLNTSLKNSYLMKYISLTLAFELGFSKRKSKRILFVYQAQWFPNFKVVHE